MDPRFAIVGGGVSGVAAMDGLVKAMKASDLQEATITMFEPSELVGPGRPYKVDQPYCWLLNHAASNIGTLNGGRKGFVNWIAANRGLLSEEFALAMKRGWVPTDPTDGLIAVDPAAFYPRSLFGMFVAACFHQIKKEAEAWGINVHVVSETVESMTKQRDGQMLIEDGSGDRHLFDQVVLASGHTYSPRTSEFATWGSYVSNIYAADERKAMMGKSAVPNLGTVAVKGTGLSANDAVLWLFEQKEQGHLTFDRILMVSRRGQLRKIRGTVGEYKMKYLTTQALMDKLTTSGGKLPLEWILDQFCKEMENAYGGDALDWENIWNPRTADIQQHLAHSLEEATDAHAMPWASVWAEFAKIRQAVFELLSSEDKGRFFKEFSTIWSSYHAPMPPFSAKRLLKGMEDGELKVEAGCASITKSESGEEKYTLTFLTAENGRPFLTHARNATDADIPKGVVKHTVEVDFLIDALGSTVESRLFPAPYPSLLQQGLLNAHRWGGIQVDPHTLHPIQANGKPLEEVWQLGVNSQGDVLIVADAPVDIVDGKRIAVSMVSAWTQKMRSQQYQNSFPMHAQAVSLVV